MIRSAMNHEVEENWYNVMKEVTVLEMPADANRLSTNLVSNIKRGGTRGKV